MQSLYQRVRRLYWSLPLKQEIKESLVSLTRRLSRNIKKANKNVGIGRRNEDERFRAYTRQILSLPEKPAEEFVDLASQPFHRKDSDCKIIAYYLTQFHPIRENDLWWGRGATEWNNVARAVPQYVGHYQPRLPGELGFYDLRLKEIIFRQIELAKMYGVYGFSFYYYWFDGKRLLETPLDNFLNSKEMDMPFCLCWANESWTKRFDGTCGDVLIQQSKTVESYHQFIESVIPYLRDSRYIRVDGKALLTIYRPSFVPDCANTLAYWREYCRQQGVGDIYLVGVREHTWDADLLALGFDAQSEFHPGTLFRHCSFISDEIDFVRNDFGGLVIDYQDIVINQKYFCYNHPKLFRAVMPMWDNTARRNNMGMIFHGATPRLYQQWLKDIVLETKQNAELEEPLVFINAWNEWGEGAYIEPDRRYGYAFLQATRDALIECRDV